MATGDIGFLDEDGFVHLADRAKDLIIRGGENIYPAEIETLLSRHPAVLESAVIGLPDERMGESVAALVRLNDGETLTEDALLSFLREQLAGFKVPSALHLVAQPLPRNAAGKLLKKQIKEEYATLAKV